VLRSAACPFGPDGLHVEVDRRGVVSLIQYQHSQGTCTVRAAAPVTAPIPSYPMAFIGCARWISKEHSLNDSRWRAVYM
jgi:hypothetical protein